MGKLIAAAAFAAAVLIVPTTPAAAAPAQEAGDDDGLREQAASTFVVDPAAKVVRVSTEMTVTNELGQDNYYFHTYYAPVLVESVNHRAVRSDGQSLRVSLEASDVPEAGFSYAVVTLRPNLFPGQSQTFRLDYELPFQPPRAAGWMRGNDAVVTFPAFTDGDPGLGRLEVRVPDYYEVEVGGDELEREEADGQIVLTADPIADPAMFMSMVVASRDDRMLSHDAEAAGRPITLRAWPNDAQWVDYMAEQLDVTMPVLEDLVGLPWPDDGEDLEVIESSTPAAHGYGGWYDPNDNTITLGDEFDPKLIAHELSHVWFNDTLFGARWINEGLADEYAQTTMQKLQLPADPAVAPDRAGPGSLALNDWADSWSFEEVDGLTEDYAYPASWYVVDQLAAEVGEDGLRKVVGVAADHEIAYGGDPDRENVGGAADWRVLLDLLQNEAGSTKAEDLFTRYVVTEEQAPLLAARRAARDAYTALAGRSDGWTPPLALRREMAAWDFDDAGVAVTQADEVLGLRADIEETLSGLDVGSLGLEDDYESAASMKDLVDEAEGTLDAARAYRDAKAHHDDTSGNVLARIGLIGSDTDAKLDDARSDLGDGKPGGALQATASVERRLDAAVRNGLLRLAGAVLILVLLLWGPVLRRRRRRARRAEVDKLEAMYRAPEAIDYPTQPPVEP